jgi:hypothetical protein
MIKQINIPEVIQSLRPNAQWVLRGTEYDGLEWLSEDVTKPTEEEINQEILRLQEEFNNTEYQRLRKAEYDKLNQDEMRFDDLVNGATTWQDAIIAIKNKYPKGVI